MKIVEKISLLELKDMAQNMYGTLVKADVDVAKKLVVIDMEMHADGEAFLLENGSAQTDLWGINLHPDAYGGDDFVEFDSMINIKPRQRNFSQEVEDEAIRTEIRSIIAEVVHE